MFHKKNNLDERQLLLRGNIYGHTFFLLMLLTVGNSALMQQGILWAEGQWSYLLIVFLSIIVCHTEMIYHNIYPMGEKFHKFLYSGAGLFSLIMIVLPLWEMRVKRIPFTNNGAVTENGCAILVGAGFLFMSFFYLYRKISDKRRPEED